MNLILLFISGCSLGSFFCLVAERVPKEESILFLASHCSHCYRRLCYHELIPLISIVLQRFRCRYCFQKVSFIYFFSELLSGLLCILCFRSGLQSDSLYLYLLITMTFILALTDWFYLIVEPKIFYPFSLLLIAWHLYYGWPVYWLTGIFVYGCFYLFNRLLRQAIGGGDILILVFWGLLFGFNPLIFIVFAATGSALLFTLLYWLFYHKKFVGLPFVPFLFIGLLLLLACRAAGILL